MKTNTITAGAVLRLTQESDIALLPAIERSAAQAFHQIPSLAWLADSEVISVARHHDYLETEHSLLAEAAGQPIGFILTEPLDDALFIVEVAVHQDWQHQGIGRMLLKQHQGIGRMLLKQVIEGAQQMGYPAVTLTTFREVPWNAPFYTRLGFTMLDELTLPAGLAAKREQETRHGLPPESRCAMRLSL
ncbi:GNAT family N-acetyltransferase [Klebsiella variicola]|uniref:GNAT family N-acetyltransferase n=1 Tax=Klebsiella variicola TaxID=244366 RepID=UPI002FE2E428